MKSVSKKLIASLLSVALVLSCLIIPGMFAFAEADVESSFANSLGLEVGTTLINDDYSSMDLGALPDWSAVSGGSYDVRVGSNGAATGIKIRKVNGKDFITRAIPEGDFVAKFTAYSTHGNSGYIDNYIGLANSSTADDSTSTYIRIYKNYIADNKTRNYAAGSSLGYTTLSDKYDLDDLTKGYTFYIFAVDGKYYFVDLDGNTMFTYEGTASHFFLGISYSEMTVTEFIVKELRVPTVSAPEDAVVNSFTGALGLETGETLVYEDYSAMDKGTIISDWVETNGGSYDVTSGANSAAFGYKMRKNNGKSFATRALPTGNFVAKFTTFSTYGNTSYVDNYIGIANSATANNDNATYVRIFKDYIANNSTRNYANGSSLGYTELSDKYDLDDLTKGYTFYIFAVDGKYYFVDLDGNTLFTYEGTASHFFIGVSYSEMTVTEFSVVALEKASDPDITYNANGGAFVNGASEVTKTENLGSAPTAEIPSFENHRFLGWSITPDGTSLVTAISAALNNKTLYAVWQDPYPADGNYTTGSVINVDFSNWVMAGNNNSYSGKDKDNNTVYYYSAKQTENGDGANDTYIRLDTTKIASTIPGLSYLPNFALTMTDSGKTNDELILPNDTTFKLTMRVRINELGGSTAELRVFYSYQKACQSGNGRFNDMQTIVSGIEETNGEWVDLVAYFTTPKNYTDNSYTDGNVCDKVYIALGPTTSALVQYDITNVKIEYSSKANLYYKENGENKLYTTLYGEPGSELKFPANTTEEFYFEENSKGEIVTYNFGTWYLGADCTEAAPVKFGNVDTAFYTSTPTSSTSSTENQDGYCGFDAYKNSNGGVSIDNTAAQITNTDAYTGIASMLVSRDTAFEIRNENAINVLAGKTYNISFYYKSASNLSVGIGVGKANALPSTASAVKTIKLDAANEWTKALVTLALPYGTTDGYALALIADLSSKAYFDNIVVSSAVNAVGAEKDDGDLRLMFTYDTAAELGNATVIIDGKSYTVSERGILVKDSDNSAQLTKENFGKNGVVGTVLTDLTNCYTYNSVTGAVVYSVAVKRASLNDNFTARGYLVLSDGTVYYTDLIKTSLQDAEEKIKSFPKNVSFNDSNQTAYVYLPEGTAISEDAPKATFYNDLFMADNTIVLNNVMQKGGFVSFASSVDSAKLTIPAELYYTVEIGAKAQLYYGVDASIVTKQLSEESKDNVNYIFITDIHYSNYGTSSVPKEERDGAIDRQMERIVKMANENDNIDFVVVGGDLTTGQYSSPESCLDAASAGISPLKKCTKPVLILMGNHDDNSYGTDTRASNDESFVFSRIVSDKYWNDRILDVYTPDAVHDTNHQDSKYYYYDIESKNTRVICLDAADKEAEYDQNGVVTGLKLLDSTKPYICTRYRTGYSFWGYSEKQLKWLATEALTAEDGWNYIFVSHMGEGGEYYNGEALTELMTAYQNKTAYSFEGEELSFSVSFNDSGKILSYQHGHVHAGSYKYLESVGIWKINTETANYRNAEEEDAENRVYQTNSEALFDLMSVNEESVYQMRIGFGKNTKFYNSP